jgi:cobalt/nickel transport system permease protein
MIRDAPLPGAGPLVRLDVAHKLVGAGVLACAVAPLRTLDAALAALTLGLGLLAACRVPPGAALRRLGPPNAFFAFMFATLALTYPGRPWPLWPAVSLDGLELGLRIAVKGNAMFCVLLALVGTSTAASAARGLQRLGLPQKFVLLLAFSYRQIWITAGEFERLRQACTARCFEPGMNMHTYRTTACLLAQTIAGSLHRAVRVRDAMTARGFDGHFRTLEPQAGAAGAGVLAVALLACAGGGLLLLDRGWLP